MHDSIVGMDAVCCWQVMTEEIWKKAVHAAATIHDTASLLALWQWLAQTGHDWNAPDGAAQVISAHALATVKPKQGHVCIAWTDAPIYAWKLGT